MLTRVTGTPWQPEPERPIHITLYTIMRRTAEGGYKTFTSEVFRDDGYNELGIVGFLPYMYWDIPHPENALPGFIVVEAIVTDDQLRLIDNYASGQYAEGEPISLEITEQGAHYAEQDDEGIWAIIEDEPISTTPPDGV